jgi:hypothetical protein
VNESVVPLHLHWSSVLVAAAAIAAAAPPHHAYFERSVVAASLAICVVASNICPTPACVRGKRRQGGSVNARGWRARWPIMHDRRTSWAHRSRSCSLG